MTAEEFENLKAGTTERRDAQVRETSNGFVIQVNRRFHDAETGTEKFSLRDEGVAQDTNLLLMLNERFFRTGTLSAEQ